MATQPVHLRECLVNEFFGTTGHLSSPSSQTRDRVFLSFTNPWRAAEACRSGG